MALDLTGFGAIRGRLQCDECRLCYNSLRNTRPKSAFLRVGCAWEGGKWATFQYQHRSFSPKTVETSCSGLAHDTLHIRETGHRVLLTPLSFYSLPENTIMPWPPLSGAKVCIVTLCRDFLITGFKYAGREISRHRCGSRCCGAHKKIRNPDRRCLPMPLVQGSPFRAKG